MGKKKSPRQPGSGPRPGRGTPGSSAGSGDKVEAAFDAWLDRNLHRLYDEVASEPLPEHLLRLIGDDKRSKGD
jgi:hypothetical protein